MPHPRWSQHCHAARGFGKRRGGIYDSFINGMHLAAMIVQKRTMNWLPRPSLYNENEAAREKRREWVKADIEKNAALSANLIGGNIALTGESINLTLRVAATRIQNKTTQKI